MGFGSSQTINSLNKMEFAKSILLILCCLNVVQRSLCFDPNRKQSISTVLNAKWSSTPFVLEMSEFLNDAKSDYFWAYLDYLTEDKMVNRKMTDREFYDGLLEFSSR